MAADGFLVAGCDGSVPQGGLWNTLPRPPEVAGVRPDAYGIAPETGKLAFGGNEGAKNEEPDAEPADGSIHDI